MINNTLVHIGNADILIKKYKGQRVVTFKDIDMVHERRRNSRLKVWKQHKSK